MMFKPFQRPNTIIKWLTYSFKRFPTSTSHIKLYCLRTSQIKNYYSDGIKQPLNPSTQREITIYDYDNSKFFLRLSFFSFVNFTLWSLFGVSTYQLVSEVPKDDSSATDSWFGGENTIVKKLVITSVALGALLVIAVWCYILRSIRSITLIEGKKNVVFETYTPFYKIRKFTVPLKHVSGVISRHKAKGYIPLKIKGKIFYFLVDVNGKFKNSSLFDSVIALKRNLN